MKKNAKETALSAVACAFSTLGLTVGTLYSPLLFTGYLFACLCMTLPLSQGYFKGAALCFAATNVLTLVFNGFNFFDTLPYTLFFGLHPLVNEIQARLRTRTAKKKTNAKAEANAKANLKTSNDEEIGETKRVEFVGETCSAARENDDVIKEKADSFETEWEVDWGAPAQKKETLGTPAVKPSLKGARKRNVIIDVLFCIFKTIWFDAATYFVWKIVFSANTAIPFIDEHILPVILIGGSLFFIFYDFLLFRMRKSISFLINKYVGKK